MAAILTEIQLPYQAWISNDEEILLEARILAVADVVDVITSFRPYRPARSIDAALEELNVQQGKQLDPAVVDAFIKVLSQGKLTLNFQ